MSDTLRNAAIFFVLCALFIGCAVLLYYIPPETLVRTIGVDNTYLVVFLLGALAGFSSLTGGSFYAAVAAFALGGAHPVLLGLCGGAGLFLSDSMFFYVVMRGMKLVRARWTGASERVARFIHRFPDWAVLLFVYVYAAIIPVPSDILLAGLALADYPYKKFGPLLAAGDLTFAMLLAFLGYAGVQLHLFG